MRADAAPSRADPPRASRPAAGPLRTIATVVVLVAVLGLVWLSLDVLLLVFAATLLAVFLRAVAAPIESRTPLSRGWSLGAAVAALVALFATAATMLSQRLAEQSARLAEELPRAVARATSRLAETPWGHWALTNAPDAESLVPSSRGIMPMTTTLLSGTAGVVTTIAVVLFLGLYLAAQPELYRNGAIRLLPRDRRARIAAVLDEAGGALRWWLVGKLFAMALIGVATTIGLIALGIQAPIALGFIAAVLTFVPNFGPVVAAVPAVLIGLLSGPVTALRVLGLYTAIQLIESYVVTPLVQERTVSLPPGLTITAQLILGAASGILGLALATPLLATGLVLVRRLYVEDVLGDELRDRPDRV